MMLAGLFASLAVLCGVSAVISYRLQPRYKRKGI